MNNDIYVSVIIPVFNEEDNLRELYGQLNTALKNIDKSYEIIFIDDGSKDRSLGVLKEFKKSDKHIKVISFYRNFGQHAAVIAGFKASSGEIVITLDADLQNPPSEIPRLIKKIEEGFDVVARKAYEQEG